MQDLPGVNHFSDFPEEFRKIRIQKYPIMTSKHEHVAVSK